MITQPIKSTGRSPSASVSDRLESNYRNSLKMNIYEQTRTVAKNVGILILFFILFENGDIQQGTGRQKPGRSGHPIGSTDLFIGLHVILYYDNG